MIAQFPTFTFTNHFSIVTGLYPAFHGIVGNVIYDSVTGETFSSRNASTVADQFWWLAEPVHKVIVSVYT
jgi:ectonucleotide pyrophosphatase/phosphodiesterase family protein 1/3